MKVARGQSPPPPPFWFLAVWDLVDMSVRVYVRTVCRCNRSPAGSWQTPRRSWPFWSRAWRQGVPKSAILAPSRNKNQQNYVQEGVLEKIHSRTHPGGCVQARAAVFLLIMLIFGHFWGPLKNRGGAKNDPKNSIRRLLGTPGRPKGEKKRFWMTLKKRSNFD